VPTGEYNQFLNYAWKHLYKPKVEFIIFGDINTYYIIEKLKVILQQAEVAHWVLVRLRPWIFLMFGTTRVVGRQSYAPAAFTPGEIPGTHFQRLSIQIC
jgi:hypothetical protein